MKKLFTLLILLASLLLVACSSSDENISSEAVETIAVNSENATSEIIEIEVPKNPHNVAVMDLAALDTIDALGKGDSIKGLSKGSLLSNLSKYYEDDTIKNLGTLKEIDFEELAALKPQLIFAGGRLRAQYDELSKIAPTILLTVNSENESPYESIKNNITEIAKIYDSEDQLKDKFASFDDRLSKIKSNSNSSSALLSIVSNGSISLLSDGGRLSLITKDAGFVNAASSVDENAHGDSASFETILQLNPETLFVLDRDQAIATEGSRLAKDVLDNEIIEKTVAFKNDRIVYLTSPVWYLSEGGLNSLDTMLIDIETITNK